MKKVITAVLVDTVAYHNRQCDFSGITSAMIPTFLRLLESNHISILSHPILDNEIRKHIKESQILERTRNLCEAVKKSKGVLKSIGFSPDDLLDSAKPEKIESCLLESYEEFSREFKMLPYVDPQEIFEDYFNTTPPFSPRGNKKSEFPDAFVIKGLLQYCKSNPNVQVLVVSNDSDWHDALSTYTQINIVKTLKDALSFLWQQLGNKTEFVSHIWSIMIPDIMTKIASVAKREAFSIEGINEPEDIEISNICATSMIGNMTPLEITENSVLVHATASLSVDGIVEYLDENRSLWDKEDQCYYFVAYTRTRFDDATAEVECEVRLTFPSDGSMKPIEIDSVRITNKWDIKIDISEAERTDEDITAYGEDDWREERDDTLEEYHKH